MPLRGARRGGTTELNPWPGYVDALSTLLMVIIFVLLVFVLAQAFLSVTLSGQDRALDKLKQQMSELTDMLALEKGKSADLQLSVSQLTHELQGTSAARDSLAKQLAAVQAQTQQLSSDRDTAVAARDKLAAELSDSQSQLAASARSNQALQAQIATLTTQGDQSGQQAVALATQVQALTALRDQLEKQVQDAAVRATTAEQRQAATAVMLKQEQGFSDSAKAQIALLNQQMNQLRAQLAQVSLALDVSEASAKQKDLQIANLGQRLNAALASKVEELQQYRSEFFGRLRQVLAGKPGIQIVGDRFVFQSEVLFPVGSAELTPEGADQINKLADTFKQIIPQIPKGIGWILQVNGYADKQPVRGAWSSNWELSAARAITVVKLLIADGVPADHLAATGYGDTHPLDPADTPDAYAKNRRIELRLTDR